jgi:hypothetical protein
MAAGTLALCYNNGAVFEGVVKMRRGLTARVFDSCSTMSEVYAWFLTFFGELQRKADADVASHDPSLRQMRAAVAHAIELCEKGAAKVRALCCVLVCAAQNGGAGRRLLLQGGALLACVCARLPPSLDAHDDKGTPLTHTLTLPHAQKLPPLLDTTQLEPPRTVSSGARAFDMLLLIGAGTYFHAAWGFGAAGGGALQGRGVLPDGYEGLEKALAVALLLATFARFALVRV